MQDHKVQLCDALTFAHAADKRSNGTNRRNLIDILQQKKVQIKKNNLKMATLLTLCKKKANLKMETVHEFVQKLQPYWHCETKRKKKPNLKMATLVLIKE